MRLGVLFGLSALNLHVQAAELDRRPLVEPVYGQDDRRDLYQVADPAILKLADSTVVLVEKSRITESPFDLDLFDEKAASLRAWRNLCEGEPFADQTALGFCSGTLVGPDLVLTAGHCIATQKDCEGTRIVFGYSLTKDPKDPKTPRGPEIPQEGVSTRWDQIYQCSRIVAQSSSSDEADFALVRLDRAVRDHAPLAIERNSKLQPGTPLVVIGHPDGIPTKVAAGAFVRKGGDSYRFLANLDTYKGNSGSPVFNARTGLIEGVLIDGEADYRFDRANKCNRNNFCGDTTCGGEKVLRISWAAGAIPAL